MRFRICTALMAVAVAAGSSSISAQSGSQTSIGVRVGTLGVGAEVSRLLNDHLGLRAGANYFNLTRTQEEEDITYDATIKLQAFSGILDWYPGKRGSFHLSVGAMSNPASLTGVGQPNGNIITINDVDYTQAQIGTLTATIEYASVLPYVGLGFGTPASSKSGFGFLFDIGAAIGKPSVLLSSSNSAANAALRADLAAEQATLQDDAGKAPIWPVISLGLSYRF